MKVEPQKEHRWLERLVGEWTYEGEAIMGPGQEPVKSTGSQSTRSIGGRWVQCEGKGEIPGGGPTTMVITLGYDTAKKRFVGTFMGSMMTNLWVYDGALDAAEKVLTLDAEGPSFTDPGKTAKYQDIIEIVRWLRASAKPHYAVMPDGLVVPMVLAGIPERTLQRAKSDMPANSHRVWDAKTERGEWYWYDSDVPWPKNAPFKKPFEFPPVEIGW